MRTGVIAKKLGMSRYYTEDGFDMPVTLLHIDGNVVVSHNTKDKNGYVSAQIGAFKAKQKKVSKPLRGHFAKNSIELRRKLKEFRVTEDALPAIGTEITANHFVKGQFVDVTGVTIGKGFAGGMKRHNFAGLEASHGVSISHRSHGSTGQCQDPGRVFPGKKMAGHMGNVQRTVQNLEVVSILEEDNIVLVCGAVPGPKNGFVYIKDSIKNALPANAPFPTYVAKNEKENAEVASDAPAEEAQQG